MSIREFSDQFDVLYNNITSNQAPGLTEYEKSVFLTKAQDEILKNYFNPKGNKLQEGFDGNQKRQIDFSNITTVVSLPPYDRATGQMTLGSTEIDIYSGGHLTAFNAIKFAPVPYITETSAAFVADSNGVLSLIIRLGTTAINENELNTLIQEAIRTYNEGGPDEPIEFTISLKFSENIQQTTPPTLTASMKLDAVGIGTPTIDERSKVFLFPEDVLFVINEKIKSSRNGILQVVPINFGEYDRLTSKPYKYPPKYQAWRLLSSRGVKYVEILAPGTLSKYTLRYVRRPHPIILADLEGLTINGFKYETQIEPIDAEAISGECELDPILHEEILQRAIELAKIAWASDQEQIASTQMNITSGQRSE